jgi:CheY-like chemotaxis protein/two-component sensor histidine kinase
MNSIEVLERCGNDEATAAHARATMHRQMKHMVRLVDDLLDVSRISHGTIELRKERVQMGPIVQHAIEAVRPLCESAEQKLIVELPPEPIWLEADSVRLAQVLTNLLSNACRYSDRGAAITVDVECENGYVTLCVTDEGIGIPAEKLETIFEMFSQIDRSLERSTGGLGLGLYLVRQLVELHGGSVEARSDGVGKGSQFLVRLPILKQSAEAPRRSAAPAVERDIERPQRRILVVDDNGDAARSLELLLRIDGHATHVAHDGLQAVEAARIFKPDIVLMDIGLPKLNGYEACQQIRQQPWGREMTLIAVTGWGQQEDKRRAVESGFDAHLVKPIDLAQLKKVLAPAQQPGKASATPQSVTV